MSEYYIPPKHEQLGIIANTPMWVREHFHKEGRKLTLKEVFDELKSKELCDNCGAILTESHYCNNCKQRIAVGVQTNGLINCLKKRMEMK